MMRYLVWLSIILAIQACSSGKQGKARSPNLLFIMMDDLGYGDFGPNNASLTVDDFNPWFVRLVKENQDYSPQQALDFSKIATPTLNRLASEGILFTNAYTSSNLCAPSRLGIATGMQQNRLGVYRNLDCEQRGLDPGSHLAVVLQDLGYATAHIGKWHIGRRDGSILDKLADSLGLELHLDQWGNVRQDPEVYRAFMNSGYLGSVIHAHNPLQNGFDYYYGYNYWASQFYNSTLVWENYTHAGKQPGYNTDIFTDKALAFIKSARAEDRPFYVQIHYHAVHDSLEPKAPDMYYNKFGSQSYDLNNFYAHVNAVDVNLQRILDYLASEDQLENTLIIFTSDNGGQVGGPSVLPGNAPFSGQKGSYFLGGIRVPFFCYWPAGIQQAKQLDQMVSTMDILPTMIDAAGGVVPDSIDGKSLLPLLKGINNEAVHEYLVWTGIHSRFWGFMKESAMVSAAIERARAPYAWVVVRHGYILRHVGEIAPGLYRDLPDGSPPTTRLYKILDDPAEVNDVSEEMPELLKSMREIYRSASAGFPPPYFTGAEKWKEITSY
jgi:uncharacterized sulfatase